VPTSKGKGERKGDGMGREGGRGAEKGDGVGKGGEGKDGRGGEKRGGEGRKGEYRHFFLYTLSTDYNFIIIHSQTLSFSFSERATEKCKNLKKIAYG